MRIEPISSVVTTFPVYPVSPPKRKKTNRTPARPGEFAQALEEARLQRIEDEKFEAYVHGLTNSLEPAESDKTEAEIAPQIAREEFISTQIEKCRIQFLRLEYMLAWKEMRERGTV